MMRDLVKVIEVFRSRGLSAPGYLVGALMRRLRMQRTRQALAKSTSNRKTFSLIYESGWWDAGGESASGPGSTLAFTESFRLQFEKLLTDRQVRALFDAPCGDWNWMKRVNFPDGMTYIGADIVPALVEKLKSKFENEQCSFRLLDITADPFPTSDLWLCRDCLAHLSFDDIRLALRNFAASDVHYAALSSYITGRDNTDIASGGFRELDLTQAPFHFPQPDLWINDWPDAHNVRRVGVWRREHIARALAASRH